MDVQHDSSLTAELIQAIVEAALLASREQGFADFDLYHPWLLSVDGAIELAQANEQTSLYLTDANDVTHEGVSIADAQTTLMEMMAAFAQAHAKKQTLRAQIDAAQTVEDVEAVTW